MVMTLNGKFELLAVLVEENTTGELFRSEESVELGGLRL
jgi:hypothetical protein